jgi:hypothetical protein
MQWLEVLTKRADGSLATNRAMPVRFVPLTGDGVRERKR